MRYIYVSAKNCLLLARIEMGRETIFVIGGSFRQMTCDTFFFSSYNEWPADAKIDRTNGIAVVSINKQWQKRHKHVVIAHKYGNVSIELTSSQIIRA